MFFETDIGNEDYTKKNSRADIKINHSIFLDLMIVFLKFIRIIENFLVDEPILLLSANTGLFLNLKR